MYNTMVSFQKGKKSQKVSSRKGKVARFIVEYYKHQKFVVYLLQSILGNGIERQ